ncbi:hypothetical protein TNCV_4229341 [Trichonephila clavipes]|nr:hypothetical protein TNCV_4229341 [Trichonephila clavipes]
MQQRRKEKSRCPLLTSFEFSDAIGKSRVGEFVKRDIATPAALWPGRLNCTQQSKFGIETRVHHYLTTSLTT